MNTDQITDTELDTLTEQAFGPGATWRISNSRFHNGAVPVVRVFDHTGRAVNESYWKDREEARRYLKSWLLNRAQ